MVATSLSSSAEAAITTSGRLLPNYPFTAPDPWDAGPNFFIGFFGGGAMTIEDGSKVSSGYGQIGYLGSGTVIVDGAGSIWENSATLSVGLEGGGVLKVSDGGVVKSHWGHVGHISGSHGQVEVVGPESLWRNDGVFHIGTNGIGFLNINGGGRVHTGSTLPEPEDDLDTQTYIATWPGSQGTLQVNASVFECTGFLAVGWGGTGTVEIKDGGVVKNEGPAFIANGPNSTGKVVVSGTNSKWQSKGNILIGADGVTPGVNGTLELQGGTVETEEVTVKSSVTINSLESGGGQLRGYGYVQGLNRMGTITPLKEIRNRGRIIAEGEYLDAPAGWFGTVGTGQLWIDGNFVQEAGGTLELTVTDVNYAGGGTIPGGGRQIPVRIHEHAQLDGKLRVAHVDISGSLNAGDRYHLMEWDSFSGRFQEFSGSVIEDRPDIFFGLHYKNNGLQLTTLETPKVIGNPTSVLTGEATGLLFVPPGYGGEDEEFIAHAQMLDAAVQRHRAENGGGWRTVTVDWSPYGTNFYFEAIRDHLNPLDDESPNVSILHDIGESTAFWMKESQIFDMETIHVAALSGGVWYGDGLVDRLKALGFNGQIHFTTMDGWMPRGARVLGDSQTSADEIGDTADYRDNYIDRRFRARGSAYVQFPNAVNFDIIDFATATTPGDVANGVGYNPWGHRFAHEYYFDTANFESTARSMRHGFLDSKEITGEFPMYDTTYSQGSIWRLSPDSDPYWVVQQMQERLDLTQESMVPSDTGTVTITEDGNAILTTGSPVMLTVFPEIDRAFNVMQFDFGFLEVTGGMLSAYLDGQQVFGISGAELDMAMQGAFGVSSVGVIFESGTIQLEGTFEAGIHTLLFRLDSEDGAQSSVHISNIRFGLETVVAIPEPSTAAMAILACILSVGLRRRFFASTKPISAPSCGR